MAGGFRGIPELSGVWLAINTGVVSVGPELRAVPVLVPELVMASLRQPETRAAPVLVPEIEDGMEL